MYLIAHGGVGSPREMDENVEKAVEEGFNPGMSSIEAVVSVVKELEDDPYFNAGYGSRLRLDGTIQTDAAVMDQNDIGAVAALEGIGNPVKVADLVHGSPFIMLAGEDASEFAEKKGFKTKDLRTKKREEELEEMKKELDKEDPENDKLARLREFYKHVDEGDTVGCVAVIDGELAAAVSTGGTRYCMRGRVGDSPLVGSGFYVGEHGAVCATGKGEDIVRRLASKRCHDLIPELGLEKACEKIVEEFDDESSIGLIAVNHQGCGSASSKSMAQASISK